MRLTNKAGLPQPILAALEDTYSRGLADISVTQLLDPPHKVWLEEQHADEIVEDAADNIWALVGNAVHYILARTGDGVQEERLFARVNDWTVSGAFDHLGIADEADRQGRRRLMLTDWKVTSVWTVVFGDRIGEWEQQLNFYLHLLRLNGHDVDDIDGLQVVAILRDWSKGEARRRGPGDSYPAVQVVRVPLVMWPEEEAARRLSEAVAAHQSARVNGTEICSPEERWAKPTTWALMKEGRKSAVRVAGNGRGLDTEDDLWQWAADNGYGRAEPSGVILNKGLDIVERPGEDTRCASYCSVAQFCEYGRTLIKEESDD